MNKFKILTVLANKRMVNNGAESVLTWYKVPCSSLEERQFICLICDKIFINMTNNDIDDHANNHIIDYNLKAFL